MKLKRFLFLILFIPSILSAQYSRGWDYFMGDDWHKEAIDHITRVESDGGVVYDKYGLNDAITRAKSDASYVNLAIWCSPQFGIKKDASNYTSKLYNIKGATGDLIQATAANQPLWTANYINGKSAIVHDGLGAGSGDYLKTASMTLNQPSVIYIGIKQITRVNNSYLYDGYNTNTGAVFNTTTSPNIVAYAGTQSSNNGNLAIGTMGLLNVVFNGASSKLQINRTTATTGNFGASNMSGLTLGAINTGTSYNSNIAVTEIRVYTAVPTTTQDSNIKAWFQSYWGFGL